MTHLAVLISGQGIEMMRKTAKRRQNLKPTVEARLPEHLVAILRAAAAHRNVDLEVIVEEALHAHLVQRPQLDELVRVLLLHEQRAALVDQNIASIGEFIASLAD